MPKPSFNHLSFILIFFISGVVFSAYCNLTFKLALIICVLFLSLALILHKQKKVFFVSLAGAIFFLAGASYQQSLNLPSGQIQNILQEKPLTAYIQAQIVDFPLQASTRFGRKNFFTAEVQAIKIGQNWFPVKEKILISVYQKKWQKETDFNYADLILLSGEMSLPDRQRNPGGFDFRQYLKRRQIYAIFKSRPPDLQLIIGRGKANFLKQSAFKLRQRLSALIEKNLPPAQGELLQSVLLGIRQAVDPELEDDFLKTGTIHILAVSGLHVGILAFVLLFLFRILRLAFVLRYILVIAGIIFYCFLSGANIPVVRATLMLSFVFFGRLLSRQTYARNNLYLAAIVILIFSPQQVFEVGFQLSFLSVFSILFFTPAVEKWFFLLPGLKEVGAKPNSYRAKATVYLTKSLSVSLAAFIGVWPVVAYYFNTVSLISCLANLVIIGLLFWLMCFGCIFLAMAEIFAPLGSFFALPVNLTGAALIFSTHFLARLGGYFYLASPPLIFFPLYYAFILLVFSAQLPKIFWKKSGVLFLLILNLLLWKGVWPREKGKMQVTFLDVGKGDSAFIEFPGGQNLLIDCATKEAAASNVVPYLRSRGINCLDTVLLTHMDEDHAGGMRQILKDFRVKNFIYNGIKCNLNPEINFWPLLKSKRVKIFALRQGDKVFLPEEPQVELLVLNPPRGKTFGKDTNNSSLVLQSTYQKTKLIFSADIMAEAMERLLYLKEIADQDLLKIAHHGGEIDFFGQKFIEKVKAQVAVNSSDKEISPESLLWQTLQKLKTKTFQTKEDGAVIFRTDGETFQISPWVK